MSPTPWRIEYLHGAPMVVDARGYQVISTVNAIEGETPEELMRTIVDGVNAAAERAKGPDLAALGRVVMAEDRAGQARSTRRHHASALLAQAVACRRCETCGEPVPDDVLPAERVDGAIELSCAAWMARSSSRAQLVLDTSCRSARSASRIGGVREREPQLGRVGRTSRT